MDKINFNHHLLAEVCKNYHIGTPISQAKLCSGGLLHRTYQFETTHGKFVAKILNPAVIKQPQSMDRYTQTEYIARELAKYTPVICAIPSEKRVYFCAENTTFMLFNYIEGTLLAQKAITASHVEKIAHTLGKIHQANIRVDNPPPIEYPHFDTLMALQTKRITLPHRQMDEMVKASLNILKIIEQNFQRHLTSLNSNPVISHRDLDPKNVLWDKNGNYYLIDWEAAGLINRAKDLATTGIYWSLDDFYKVDIDRLLNFLKAYKKIQGIIPALEFEAGLYGLLVDWMNWLDFNLSRILNNPQESEEFIVGVKESQKTLTALPILFQQLPRLIKIFREQFSL